MRFLVFFFKCRGNTDVSAAASYRGHIILSIKEKCPKFSTINSTVLQIVVNSDLYDVLNVERVAVLEILRCLL